MYDPNNPLPQWSDTLLERVFKASPYDTFSMRETNVFVLELFAVTAIVSAILIIWMAQ